MALKKFNSFQINEDFDNQIEATEIATGETTLYRLTSHSVIDLNDPGEFYFSNKEAVTPDLLDNKGSELFLLTVKTDVSNIDKEASEKEAVSHGNESIVVVKDSTLCSVVSVAPFQS